MTVATGLETPLFFTADGEDLFGVFTSPEREPTGVAVLVLFGAGDFPSPGKNQVRARLATGLADLGYHVLRFDYQGVGDSGGDLREDKDLDPSDALAAVRWLAAQGFDRIFVVGVCWGAVVALDILAEIPQAAGLALVGLPMVATSHREVRMAQRRLSWYVKRGASLKALRLVLGADAAAKRRRATFKESIQRALQRRPSSSAPLTDAPAAPSLMERVAPMLDSGVPVLLLYGRQDAFFASFDLARAGRLGELLEAAGPHVTVQIEDGALVNMASTEDQDVFLSSITGFVGGLAHAERARQASRGAS